MTPRELLRELTYPLTEVSVLLAILVFSLLATVVSRMLEWPSTGPAFELARSWLGWLLRQDREVEALKLMTRCLRENPGFRPWPSDVEAATALARRCKRDDLLPGPG